jgi:hypothetical protein
MSKNGGNPPNPLLTKWKLLSSSLEVSVVSNLAGKAESKNGGA